MKMRHLLSDLSVFVLTDAAGNFVAAGSSLAPSTQYVCRLYQNGSYVTQNFYGSELQPAP